MGSEVDLNLSLSWVSYFLCEFGQSKNRDDDNNNIIITISCDYIMQVKYLALCLEGAQSSFYYWWIRRKILALLRKRRDLIQGLLPSKLFKSWIIDEQGSWKFVTGAQVCHRSLTNQELIGIARDHSCLWYWGGILVGTPGSCYKTFHLPSLACLPTSARGAVTSGFLPFLKSYVDSSQWWSPV